MDTATICNISKINNSLLKQLVIVVLCYCCIVLFSYCDCIVVCLGDLRAIDLRVVLVVIGDPDAMEIHLGGQVGREELVDGQGHVLRGGHHRVVQGQEWLSLRRLGFFRHISEVLGLVFARFVDLDAVEGGILRQLIN